MLTGDAEVVAEDETAGGGDDASEEDVNGKVARVLLATARVDYRAARHRFR